VSATGQRVLSLVAEAATLERVKRRARRVTIAAAVLGTGVLAVLVALNWSTVRDHCDAWRFQLARKTKTIQPLAVRGAVMIPWPVQVIAQTVEPGTYRIEDSLFRVAANEFRCSVTFDPEEVPPVIRGRTVCNIRRFLAASGYRILEQRFPRRAYVLIRDQGATR
jgi:hypothetical protein